MTEYLTRTCELEKHAALSRARGEEPCPNGWLDQIHWLAGGDEELFAFAWAAANFSHAWDDLIDGVRCEGSGIRWEQDMIEAAQAALCGAIVSTLRTGLNGVSDTAFDRAWNSLLNGSQWGTEQVFLATKALQAFFFELGSNDFVRRHAQAIETLLVMCMTRMLDGDAMAASADAHQRALAPAVSCGDVDFYMGLVYLARGWAALRACSKFRAYDEPADGGCEVSGVRTENGAHGVTRPTLEKEAT